MPFDHPLPPLPAQPEGVAWPTQAWPEGTPAPGTDTARLNSLLDRAFADPAPEDMGETHAFLAVQGGRIVSERYWRDYTPGSTFPSWSEAKSITQALIGILVRDGRMDIHAPADVPEWQTTDDPRQAITLDMLLRMSSGLKFVEDYVPGSVSDVIEMLFGSGQLDVAAYAANQPLEHDPDTFWSYSSGTSNIVARCAARTLGADADAFRDFMFRELFSPIGMRSPLPKFDAAGTFIGSSFCYCTARDFARFGLLYLRGGVWDGRRILPEGWADYARTPTPAVPETETLGYGAHWWLGMAGPGSFSCNGYEGQYTVLVPEKDLILVRHGKSPLEAKDEVQAWLADVAECF
ncbi:serine hydrolase domain-containing protein [Hyphomonas jannaschiana]|uniref:Beta-lactamase n=1 Tax=Hyphomonas jannaschiana VP2 TaxID=1280952 RepID=A0A059F6E0_9PROT|nr:serine hydrolase [Hyphomonas jannaschiana]KCZ83310.1 beta-lactamase [Hyphomonas jannaschiana VP2]